MKLKVALKQKLIMGVMTLAMAAGMVSLSGVTAFAEGETTEGTSHVCYLQKAGDSTKYYYTTIQNAIDASDGKCNSKVTLLKDCTENIYIDKPVTIDLSMKTLTGNGKKRNGAAGTSTPYGPIYITTNEPGDANKVLIENGTVCAEIDGLQNFDDEEIKYKGPVELNNIKLVSQTGVSATVWTDGHPYTMKNCDFSAATIQNLTSDVTIDGGTYNGLVFHGDDGEKFGVAHVNREFHIVSGTFITPTGGVDDYIEPGSKKDNEASNETQTVVTPIPNTSLAIPGDAVMTGNTGHSITIKADPEVQYSLESTTGPWYRIENGKLVRIVEPNAKTVFDNGVDPDYGVSLTAPDMITFTKNYGVSPATDLEKGKDYTVYSRYTKAAVEADPKKNDAVAKDTKLPTAPTDAREVGELFVKGDGTTTSTGSGKDEKADNAKVEVTVSPDGKGYIAKLKDDIDNGPIVIPDNYGDVTIDLNGHTIKGADGTKDSPEGKDAIDVTKGTGSGTTLNIVDNSEGKGGKVIGGNGYDGSGANGGDGVDIADDAKGTVNIGKGVTVSGGNGADSSDKDGGIGGKGVDGNIGKNEGTITGGNGGNFTGEGNGDKGPVGGDGGVAVDGNVADNQGTISGGNGGSGINGGGAGANGATGNVAGNGTNTAGTKGETVYVTSYSNTESLEYVEKLITSTNTDKGDIMGSSFSLLRLKAVGKKKQVKLTWRKQANADGYILYGNRCGKNLKKIKEFNNKNKTSYTDKKLKKGKYYKYLVVAYKNFGTEKRIIAKSITAHSITNGGKYTNPTGIKIKSKKTISVNKGKTSKINATYLKKGPYKVQKHVAIVRYESSNKKVATVDKKGKLKAVGKGKATIYVYAQNGFYKTVKVTVK